MTDDTSKSLRQDPTGECVRLYVNENDMWHGRPLGLAILTRLRELGGAGATLFRGSAGYGGHGQIHTGTLVDVTPALPVVVEWVDSQEAVNRLLPSLLPMLPDGMVIRFPVSIVQTTRRALLPLSHRMSVASVMTRDVVTARETTPLENLVAELIDRERRSVIVVDDHRAVVGIITNGDLIDRGGLRTRVHFLSAMGSEVISRELATLARDKRTASDVMTHPVVTVEPNVTIRNAAHLMSSRRLKRLPVIEHGRLVGIVSRADLLRSIIPMAQEAGAAEEPAPQAGVRVGDILTRDVPIVQRDTSLPDVLATMITTRLGRAIVVDARRRPIGVISGAAMLGKIDSTAHAGILASLVRRLPFGQGESAPSEVLAIAAASCAVDLMSAPVDTVVEATSVAEAAAVMLEHRRKILPVVDEAGVLVGMVDRFVLLRALHTSVSGGEASGINHETAQP